MYRLGHHNKHHYWPFILIGCLVIICVISGVIWFSHIFSAKTYLKQAKSVTHYVAGTTTTLQHIVERTFSVDIPVSWKAVPPPSTQPTVYSWTGEATDGTGRRLDIYIDQVPSTLAVNRLLPVQVAGNKLETVGTVSDNCVNFTNKSTENAATGTAPAKWDGVSFICDMGNYERDVVAVGSAAGVNSVILNGPMTGSHAVLLVYTNDGINPTFSNLTSIVQSFQVR
jgi:hypothetical protein